jgi:outer membrane protein assembly factor BamA
MTEIWQPRAPPLELHWELLRLPERVFRLALTPLYPLIDVFERYRLGERVYDLLTNDARTIMVFPLVFFLGTDGFGSGLSYRQSKLFGRGDRKFSASAALYANLDYEVSAHYEQTVAELNGRGFSLDARYLEDDNVRFYGIGGDTTASDERGLRRESVEAGATFEVIGPQFSDLHGEIGLTYRRERLLGGTRRGVPSLGKGAGDAARLPPGFERTLDYLEGRIGIGIDRRQPPGRTTGGWTADFDLNMQHDLNGAGLSALRLGMSGSLFALVLPRYRVLVLSAGAAAAFPWGEATALPLGGHVSLGRTTHLRGYARDRFFDRYAWWASAEYRYPIVDYPIHEHVRDDLTISFTVFADIARAGDALSELFGEAPRWSSGFGLHFATATYSLLLFQLGFSPEGVEFTFTVGSLP